MENEWCAIEMMEEEGKRVVCGLVGRGEEE